MTRQREIPSILYRHPNQINMTFPITPGVPKIRVSGAARLADAYGAVAGVAGNGLVTMFEVSSGETYLSPSIRARKLPAFEDTNRGISRMVFDLDDFATPALPFSGGGAGSYIPTDDQTLFIRIATWNNVTSAYNPPGPIIVIPPYDFFTTKAPMFTITSIAPSLNIAAWPTLLPDFLPPSVLNFLLPAYGASVSIENLTAAGGVALFASFHPGVPPTVIKADKEIGLTGVGVPEFFIASPNGNPFFTIRIAIVNSA